MLAVLYDIHGNTAALEAVLRDADAMRVDRYLGGDFGEFAARWILRAATRRATLLL